MNADSKFYQLLDALQREGVRFVVIGVSGANFWAFHGGQIFTTKDRDLFLPPDPDNELRAWNVCERLGFDLWISDEPLGKPKDHFLAERITERRIVITATASDLIVDLSLTMAGFAFDDVWNEHRVFRVDGVDVPVARLTHIVESKRIANRAKDRLFLETHAEALRQLLRGEKP